VDADGAPLLLRGIGRHDLYDEVTTRSRDRQRARPLPVAPPGAPTKNGHHPMIHRSLEALVVTPGTGDEPFTHQGKSIGADLLGFWRWAYSDLVSNATRGVLAEYIVGLALGYVDGRARLEWDMSDLRTPQGKSVEVKSAAYVQTWQQEKLSKITFNITPTNGWDAATNTVAAERKRQADVYVFCLLKHTDKATVCPLNLDQWDFYVLSTNRLNNLVGEQKTITLANLLLKLRPSEASFAQLRDCVEVAAEEPATAT
jgi:hypothetical protein